MKLSLAIASKEAAESAFVVYRGIEESIEKASKLGYHGVELALKRVDEVDREKLGKWLKKWNMEVSAISTGQVFSDLGLYFTHKDDNKRRETIEVFKGLIDLAADYGKIINVGRARGFVDETQTKEQAQSLFLETMRLLCDYAEPKGVTIIIEPVNRYEINFVNNLDQGYELAELVGKRNIGLMPDVFHMNIEDDDIAQSLVRNGKYVKYIHFADSNRLSPGKGHLDFKMILNALKTIGFDGWASVEILPEPDPDVAAACSAETLLPLIEEYSCNGGEK